MGGILKSSHSCCSRCTHCQKSVSFPSGPSLCTNVHEADDWDRRPVAPTRKLTYQDVLELKEMQIALLKNNPAFPHLLSTVPIGLVPLLPPIQPDKAKRTDTLNSISEVDELPPQPSPSNLSTQSMSNLDLAPTPPISVPQSATPTRKFYLPILPLQEPISPPQILQNSPPASPLPASPKKTTARSVTKSKSKTIQGLSTSPSKSSPLMALSSLSLSTASLPCITHRSVSRSPEPTITTTRLSSSPSPPMRNLSLGTPRRRSSTVAVSTPSHKIGFSTVGLPGISPKPFRDMLPPNPIFAPYYTSSILFNNSNNTKNRQQHTSSSSHKNLAPG